MPMRNDHNRDDDDQNDELSFLDNMPLPDNGKKLKPHVVRRNVEDYLERRALERRLKDIFDNDF